ncbi:MAG: AlpA family transcriptional regulator [Desulfobacterales bacterium]|nr:AlpA family transcriptional regulator [Desulfobacterales bacterium]
MGLRILRRKDVEDKIGLKHAKIYIMMNEGIFPRPIQLGPKSVGWVESEIDEWLMKKIKERDECTAEI